jgi:uncharacterized membrane protein YhaH (DUF805 family)
VGLGVGGSGFVIGGLRVRHGTANVAPHQLRSSAMRTLPQLIRFWFTFEDRVTRGAYLAHGLALAALKYVVDAALIWYVAGLLWTPWDYLTTGAAFATSKLKFGPGYLLTILAIWTLPFLWIGLAMSIRRALDAGYSAWLALLFFLPVMNYALMLFLSVHPSEPARPPIHRPRPHEAKLPSALLSIAAGMAVALGMVALSVYGLGNYGAALFAGTPFVVGAVSAYLFNRRYAASGRETAEVVSLTLAAVGGLVFAFGVEGAICLFMVVPLAIPVAILGGFVGRAIALRDSHSPLYGVLAIVLLPPLTPVAEPNGGVALHEVRSSIVIDAPPEAVWRHVIAFSPIPEPSRLVVRAGIAYPQRARIEGSGVGAVRYCEFSTGAFVEPIRVWEPGRRLAFDVTRQPPPLREWSPYANVVPPHLDGYFLARRGEFRLVRLTGNRTRLEGSTWYELRIEPVVYWSVFADLIVGRIHRRVLEHIRNEVR